MASLMTDFFFHLACALGCDSSFPISGCVFGCVWHLDMFIYQADSLFDEIKGWSSSEKDVMS